MKIDEQTVYLGALRNRDLLLDEHFLLVQGYLVSEVNGFDSDDLRVPRL